MRTATSARMAPSTFTQLLSSVCVRRNHMRFMRAAAEDGGPGCSSQVLRPVKPRRTDTTRTTDVKVGGSQAARSGEPVSKVGGASQPVQSSLCICNLLLQRLWRSKSQRQRPENQLLRTTTQITCYMCIDRQINRYR